MDVYIKLIILICIYLQNGCKAQFARLANIPIISVAYCRLSECCQDSLHKHDSANELKHLLRKKLIGQHLVMKVVPNVIKQHLLDNKPKKALVLSFHGSTGTGKNFVTELIAQYIYKKGLSSKFVHRKIGSQHYSNPDELEDYKKELKKFIKEKTSICSRSLFIFDEVEKMPSSLTDVLTSFLGYYHDIDGIDYRKNIFIFLSNIGGTDINVAVLNVLKSGGKRESISSKKMEEILSIVALKSNGGFKDSSVILSGVVDFFIPFLLMERYHVKLCIIAEIGSHEGLREKLGAQYLEVVENVANEIQYFVGDVTTRDVEVVHKHSDIGMFSKNGCKLIAKKLYMFI